MDLSFTKSCQERSETKFIKLVFQRQLHRDLTAIKFTLKTLSIALHYANNTLHSVFMSEYNDHFN